VSDPIISLDRVSKHFGAKAAVSDVTFEVMPGRCIGWLGPNGSGKTTLIRCMLGLARVSSGTIHVRGHEIPKDVHQALTRVGGIVEEPRFYPYLSGKRNLEVWASYTGGEARTRVDWALGRVGLSDRAGSPVKQYSQGMRQRLGVARSLLADPELLILDEPSNGLDPAGIAEFRDMIRSFVEQEGRTVFISSHLLDEVQKMADDIAIVQAGKLVLHGSVQELVAGGRQTLRIRVDAPDRAEATVRALGIVTAVTHGEHGNLEVSLGRMDDESSIAITRALVEAGVGVVEVVRQSESLEDRFLEITAGSTAGEMGEASS
jgi:ABC-2 type transport system ATP-binding protein